MTTVEIIGLVASLITVFFSVISALEARFVKRLLKNGATRSEKAMEIPRMLPVMRWRIGRLERAGAVHITETNRFHLDEAGYQLLKKRRRKIALPIAATAVLLVITIFLLVN